MTTSTRRTVYKPDVHWVDVIGLSVWSDEAASWDVWRRVLQGHALPEPRPSIPTAQILSAAERRRVPQAVSLALHVAEEAVQAAGVDPHHLPSVFASCHGDLGTTDAMCDVLARDPTSLSPTRFMQSVHNTASGCWSMAHGCTQASVAMASGRHTLAASMLEAASQALCGANAVLWVLSEVRAQGALTQLTTSPSNHAFACVLRARGDGFNTHASDPSMNLHTHRLGLQVVAAEGHALSRGGVVAAMQHDDAVSNHPSPGISLGSVLPWLRALAVNTPSVVALPLGMGCDLRAQVQPLQPQASVKGMTG